MNSDYRNYYKVSREASGLTQGQAAELIGVSVRTLSSYENWEVTPNNETVEKMMSIYQNRRLGWWHLRYTSNLARTCLPELHNTQSYADIYTQIDFAKKDIRKLKKMIREVLLEEKSTPNVMEKLNKIQEIAKKIGGSLIAIYAVETPFVL